MDLEHDPLSSEMQREHPLRVLFGIKNMIGLFVNQQRLFSEQPGRNPESIRDWTTGKVNDACKGRMPQKSQRYELEHRACFTLAGKKAEALNTRRNTDFSLPEMLFNHNFLNTKNGITI